MLAGSGMRGGGFQMYQFIHWLLKACVQVHEGTRVKNVSLTVGSCLLMFLISGAPESGTLSSTQGPQELSPPILFITGRDSPG